MVQVFDLEQIVRFEQQHKQLSQIIYLVYLLVNNIQRFSYSLYKSAVVLLAYMGSNQYCLDKYIKQYFYNTERV